MTRAGAQRELEALMERWAELVERGDAAAVAELCTEDAVILASDAPTARGRTAIRQLVQSWIDAGESNDRSSTIDAFVAGKRAALARTYLVDFVEDGATVTEGGRYLATFRHERGEWRIEALAIFADPA